MRQMNQMRILGLIMPLVLFGCAGFDREELVEVSELSTMQSDDDAQKNLAAIRAMLAEQRQRAPLPPDSIHEPKPEPGSPSWPPDWLASYFLPKGSSGQESDRTSLLYMAPPPSSLSKRRAAPQDFTIKIPWVPEPPSRGSEAEPRPPVPAYTSPAPIGSAYPGSTRCVPDLLGGQRCYAD